MYRIFFIIIMFYFLSGCASAANKHAQIEFQLNGKIECKTAEADVIALKAERSSTLERLSNGIATILPSSAIMNLLTGEYKSRREIATGKLNQALYMKIMEIESMCMT